MREVFIDHTGMAWPVPTVKGRLRPSRVASHAALKAFVIRRDGGRCRWCGSDRDLVADHVVSYNNGGSHHPRNLQALCDSCNAGKANSVDKRGVRRA